MSETWTKPAVRRTEGKPIPRAPRGVAVQTYVPAWLAGTGVSMKHFFQNAKERVLGQKRDPVLENFEAGITTIEYPEEKRPYPERFRGLHRLTIREDNSPRCVACLCCSTACPAQCIHIEPSEYPEGDPRRGYERFPAVFVIDELRCIYCGMCEEACPVDAVELTSLYNLTGRSREEMVFDKEKLLSVYDATKDAEPMKSASLGGTV